MENFSKINHPKSGVSLIEVIISLLICSILFAVFSSHYPQIQRMTRQLIGQAAFEEKYLIFLIKFEEQFQQAEIVSEDQGKIKLNIDYNEDGTHDQSNERITYNWSSTKQRIEQSTGNGAPNGILDGISSFSWTRQDSPLCYQFIIQSIYHNYPQKVKFCREL